MTKESSETPSVIRDLDEAFKASNANPADEGPLEAVRNRIQSLNTEERISLIQSARNNAVALQDQPGGGMKAYWNWVEKELRKDFTIPEL